MLNTTLGDCTIAGCGHAVQCWSGVTVPDSTILSYYEKWDGYNPSDPDTDQGGVEIDVLNNWRTSDFAGHKILGYASVSPKNPTHIEQAIYLLGGTYIGVELPVTAQSQTIWDVSPTGGDDAQPGSWGGHCVWVLGYDHNYLTCVTWGKLLKMTWAFWDTYCSEAYAILSGDWKPPVGFDLAQLQADLQIVSQ